MRLSEHPSLWGSARTAEFLDVPPRTLDAWAYLGTGPAFFKVGRHRRYDPAEVEAWLESRKSEQRPA